ncbi:MAG: hypothetical protein Q8M01_05475 [Rubrivivax sp.]|nr:hypothetical protein [Rubrivivax sp.]
MLAPRPTCRHCGQPLSPLRQRLADSCEAPACRHRAVLVRQLQRRRAQLEAQRDHAAARGHDPRLLQAPVVWLRHHGTEMAAVSAEESAGHAAELAALAADPEAHPRKPNLDGWPEDAGPAPAADGAVCGFCRGRGRCCRVGRACAGFVDVGVLRAWQQGHGGSLADAAAHDVSRLPAEHVAARSLPRPGCTLRPADCARAGCPDCPRPDAPPRHDRAMAAPLYPPPLTRSRVGAGVLRRTLA